MSQLLGVFQCRPVFRGTDVVLLAYVPARDGHDVRPAVAGDFATITYVVWADGAQVGGPSPESLDPTAVIYDTPQNGDIWPSPMKDETPGFNFETPLSRAYLPGGGLDYVIIVTFTTIGGDVSTMEYVVPTLQTASD